MEQSLYEKLGGSYTKVGEHLLPDLTNSDTPSLKLQIIERLEPCYGRIAYA